MSISGMNGNLRTEGVGLLAKNIQSRMVLLPPNRCLQLPACGTLALEQCPQVLARRS
jgi:hypothetical protein